MKKQKGCASSWKERLAQDLARKIFSEVVYLRDKQKEEKSERRDQEARPWSAQKSGN